MDAPEIGTVERWAWDYVTSTSLAHKLSPEPPPVPRAWEPSAPVRRLSAPGRPPELRVTERADKTRGIGAPSGRARALHTFLHHELQAAELMAWALLAFPDGPLEFREGLIRIALDEARHQVQDNASEQPAVTYRPLALEFGGDELERVPWAMPVTVPGVVPSAG